MHSDVKNPRSFWLLLTQITAVKFFYCSPELEHVRTKAFEKSARKVMLCHRYSRPRDWNIIVVILVRNE